MALARRILAVAIPVAAVSGLLVLAWGVGDNPSPTTGPAQAAEPAEAAQPARAAESAATSAAGRPTTQPEAALPPLKPQVKAKADKALAAGARYLLSVQEPDGSWGGNYGPAITAMAVKALVQAGHASDSPPVAKAVAFVLAGQNKAEGKLHGAFATKELANYNTAICLSTLVMLNARTDGKPYEQAIRDALAFLRRDQWDESEGVDKDSTAYGGFGYGGGQRPDMSNTNTTMDALKALKDAGYLSQDDPMFEKVRVFVEHSQNRSESNKVQTFQVGDDGGFIYTPAISPTRGGAESKAGEVTLPSDRSSLRSYGSMTYAGFKSYVYSGLTRDDPRVRDAYAWVRKNYSLAENPGMGAEGLYYYYHTMARALAVSGQPTIRDAANVAHDWRAELIDRLASLQKQDGSKEDGSWVNEKASRWEEGNPVLATCFAMLALEEMVK